MPLDPFRRMLLRVFVQSGYSPVCLPSKSFACARWLNRVDKQSFRSLSRSSAACDVLTFVVCLAVPTHDQALQQLVLLKKELAELQAHQGLQEATPGGSILEQQISRARGGGEVQAEVDMERSAHRETIEALEASEGSYLTLLRGVASALEMDEVEGLRSMAHLPRDERLRLASLREQAVELLTSRVRVLKERIARKDELLQGYERDLARLRCVTR